MLWYYYTIALRNALRTKLYAIISVAGLSLGLSTAVMIGIYVNDELSYDRWIPDSENIYRVAPTFGARRGSTGPSDLGLWLKQDYKQISEVTRAFVRSQRVTKEEFNFNESILWADSNFFEVFNLETVEGTLDAALTRPSDIVITQRVAKKYFGEEIALGKTLVLDGEHPMQVAAVLRDVRSNSHFNLSIIAAGHATHSALIEQDQNPVMNFFGAKLWATYTYIKVDPDVSVSAIEADLDAMMDRHLPRPEGRKNSEIYQLEILPIEKIHLAPADLTQGDTDMSGIYTVLAIAFLILLAASTNYVNMMIARGMKRAPEIAIRKTVGANRGNLIMQFLVESSMFVVFSFIMALILCYFLLPLFNSFLQRTIGFDLIENSTLVAAASALVLLTILFAGMYPALLLSRLSPLDTFRTNQIKRRGFSSGGVLQQLLSVVQFAILTGLLIATFTIYQQSQFGITQALNKTSDPVVILNTPCDEPLKRALSLIPEVKAVGCAGQIPQWGVGPTVGIRLQSDDNRNLTVSYTTADVGLFELFGLELAAGRYFEEERSSDQIRDELQFNTTTAVIVNETFVREMEFDSAQEAISEVLVWRRMYQRPTTLSPQHQVEIIGVLRDFQIGNVRQATPPAVFYVQRNQGRVMAVQIDGQNVSKALEEIDKSWEEIVAGRPIQRQFFDQTIELMYRDVTQQASLLGIYALVAVAIAVLGLIGLAAFDAEKRTKEIGIRKVLGGSRLNIVTLLLWQFSKPVLISNLLAWPVAFYYLTIWLQGFERHVDLSIFTFATAGVATCVLALVTVFAHAFLITGTKPITALRYE